MQEHSTIKTDSDLEEVLRTQTFRINMVSDKLYEQIEYTFKICIKRRPRFWPQWFYKWILRKIVIVQINNSKK